MGRKFIVMVLAAALAFGAGACGKQEPTDKRSGREKSVDNAGKALVGGAQRAKKAAEGN